MGKKLNFITLVTRSGVLLHRQLAVASAGLFRSSTPTRSQEPGSDPRPPTHVR